MKFRNIGDVLLVSPILRNIKKHYPDSVIDIAVNKGTEAMVEENPAVNRVVVYDRNRIKSLGFFSQAWKEWDFIWSFRKEQYDLVINLTEGDRGAQIALFSKSKIRVGYQSKNRVLKDAFTHHLPKTRSKHTVESNLDALRVLGIPITSKKSKIYYTDQDRDLISRKLSEADLNLGDFIHIHPVSRWLFKCLSDRIIAQIIDYCELELRIKVVLTAAPVEQEVGKVNSILSLCKSKPVNFSGSLSLGETAALNNMAKMFIGVDTAIMHISAANDTPVLAFFGPSGAFHWGPWDNSLMESGYVKRNGCQSMGMHQVISESRQCQPCGQDGCGGTKISSCLLEMDPKLILKSVSDKLASLSMT